ANDARHTGQATATPCPSGEPARECPASSTTHTQDIETAPAPPWRKSCFLLTKIACQAAYTSRSGDAGNARALCVVINTRPGADDMPQEILSTSWDMSLPDMFMGYTRRTKMHNE